MVQAFVIAFAFLLQAAAAQQQPIERTLDVLTIPAPPPRPVGPACSGCDGGGRGEVAPLKVTLVQVTPRKFSVGDEIVLELLVKHVGHTPILLGISRDPELAPSCRPANGDVRTRFMLATKRGGLLATSPGLYGSESVAATTMSLKPGERLRVRAPARVNDIGRRRPYEDNPPLEVVGVFYSEWDRCRGSVYVPSRASLPVFVSWPRR